MFSKLTDLLIEVAKSTNPDEVNMLKEL